MTPGLVLEVHVQAFMLGTRVVVVDEAALGEMSHTVGSEEIVPGNHLAYECEQFNLRIPGEGKRMVSWLLSSVSRMAERRGATLVRTVDGEALANDLQEVIERHLSAVAILTEAVPATSDVRTVEP